MIAIELNNGAIKPHRDTRDDPTERRLAAGKAVTLQPHAPEKWEREELEKEEVRA